MFLLAEVTIYGLVLLLSIDLFLSKKRRG